jgi:hypothetical protein
MVFRMIDNVMIRMTNHIQEYLLTSGIRSIQIVHNACVTYNINIVKCTFKVDNGVLIIEH